MKKITLTVVFCFTFLIVNSSNFNRKNQYIIAKDLANTSEYFGCIMKAYRFANWIEVHSPGGENSWTSEEWGKVFSNYLSKCNEPDDIVII
jgi:cytoplasmic iron level regulating protein YaaA (DUF328/UPF0246 family)